MESHGEYYDTFAFYGSFYGINATKHRRDSLFFNLYEHEIYVFERGGRKLAVLNVSLWEKFPLPSPPQFMNGFKWKYNEEIARVNFLCRYSKNLWKILKMEKLLINAYELNRNTFAIRGIFIFQRMEKYFITDI